MGVITHHGNAVEWAKGYSGPLFHALLCDAPYEMGFMGKDWDSTGVAFQPETWESFARVLYPGAFLFVMAGTINDDLISVAMREAGLRKFHKMMGWAYGSGFPKASRIDANLEKRRRDEIRHVCRYLRGRMEEAGKSSKEIASHFGFNARMVDHWAARETDSQPSIPTWTQWVELKKILNFNGEMDSEVKRLNNRKGTYGEDWEKREIVGRATNGAGNTGNETVKFMPPNSKNYDITSPATDLARAWEGHRYGLQAFKPAIETILVFQKPYEGKPIDNITETGAGALNIEGGKIEEDYKTRDRETEGGSSMFGLGAGDGEFIPASGRWPSNFLLLDEAAARALDQQSGILKTGATKRATPRTSGSHEYGFKESNYLKEASEGGASRFFFRVSEQIDEADPVFYSAKASRGERDAGLGDLSLRNPHPTVKPLSLCQYLATLILPPIEYAPRRIFVPFAGVGSEEIGAHLAGWEEIEGVELQEEYIPINRARVEYWQKKPKGSKRPKNKIPENVKNSNQMELI